MIAHTIEIALCTMRTIGSTSGPHCEQRCTRGGLRVFEEDKKDPISTSVAGLITIPMCSLPHQLRCEYRRIDKYNIIKVDG